MAGAGDVAGLDLEVRDGVGAGPVGQQEVAILLVAVRARRGLADEDIADPDGVRPATLKRSFVGDPRAGPRGVVVDEDLLLDVLPRGCEVGAVQFDVAPLAVQVHGGVDAHHVAVERDHDVAEEGIASDPGEVACNVEGVAGPLLHAHHGELRAVLDDDLDVLAQRRRSRVVQDEVAAAVPLRGDHGVRRPGCRSEPAPAQEQVLRLVAGHGDREGAGRARPRVGRRAILRDAGGSDARVVPVDPVQSDPGGGGGFVGPFTPVEHAIEKRAELRHGRELPDGFESRDVRVVGDEGRGEAGRTRLHGHIARTAVAPRHRAGGDGVGMCLRCFVLGEVDGACRS